MIVYFVPGQAPEGAGETPTNTMSHTLPHQLPQRSFRDSHCCCDMELTVELILESARKPPLQQFPSDTSRLSRMCIRRNDVPCDTEHVMVPTLALGFTGMFSADRQKFWVDPGPGPAPRDLHCSSPLMVTLSGGCPNP